MLQELIGSFIQSGGANDLIAQVTQKTELDEGKAREAVHATAEGAASAVGEQGGLASLAGSLLSGGGLADMAGSLLGGGGGAQAAGGLPPQLVQTVTTMVAEKTGISAAIAGVVVNMALPKIMSFFQGGGDSGGGDSGGGGGLLGGLLG